MTEDARFEHGAERPLRLRAESPEDLQVVSALLQDAVAQTSEIAWARRHRRFSLLVNRFRWEDEAAAERQGRPFERVQAVLAVDGVLNARASGVDPKDRDLVLSLKSRGVAVLLNSHLIGEVERVCDRVVILDKGRVAASGTLAELLGQREVRLRLAAVDARAEDRLRAAGSMTRSGEWFTVQLASDDDGITVPDLVRDLVAVGARVHAVEPGRISLEERLLAILRAGSADRPEEDR